MLSELISRFFDKQDPQPDLEKRLEDNWKSWLQPISMDKPAGEDLTYHDVFQEVKEEIAKLSGIDYSLVMAESEAMLKTSSKDIRIATYYCLSRLHLDGAEGFADGLELLAGLMNRFGDDLYPTRKNIRKNAIEWLANVKFIEPLNKLQPIPEENLSRIIAALDLIEQSSQKLFASGDDPNQTTQPPDLDALIRFFSNGLKQKIKVQTPDEIQSITSEPPPTDEHKNTESSTIRSQRDLLDQARRIATFLREKPDGYLAAGRFLRILRWDTINHLPPCDNKGWTRLPAPRAELKQHISRLMIQQQWTELFERVEMAFMENANHFWLDLQRFAVIALQKKGDIYQSWADIYLADIGLMLERLNGIERLCFDNGTPFADDETLNWIASVARIHHLDEGPALNPIVVSGEDDWEEIEKQALELAHSESLEKAFQWLQSLTTLRSAKQRYLLQYTQARIAEKIGQYEIASQLFVGLNSRQSGMTLVEWEPSLAFDVKTHLLKILKQKSQLKDSGDKELLFEQIERLHRELVLLDPARALSVISY